MTTWHADTPPWYRDAAERVCTAKQLEVLKLASHDPPTYQHIGDQLGISRQAVHERVVAAHRAIRRHLDRQEPAA